MDAIVRLNYNWSPTLFILLGLSIHVQIGHPAAGIASISCLETGIHCIPGGLGNKINFSGGGHHCWLPERNTAILSRKAIREFDRPKDYSISSGRRRVGDPRSMRDMSLLNRLLIILNELRVNARILVVRIENRLNIMRLRLLHALSKLIIIQT